MRRGSDGSWRAAFDAALLVFRHRELRRAESSFGAAWAAEWALSVGLGVVAFRDGGAVAVGVVYFVRMLPAALVTPVASSLGDRFPRDLVLRWACAARALAVGMAALALAVDASLLIVYGAASAATVAFTLYRPGHSALLPSLCSTPGELVAAHVVRGLIDSLGSLVGPLLAAVLLAVADPAVLFGTVAALSALSGWLLTGLRYERPPAPEQRQPMHLVADTLDGLRRLTHVPDARRLVELAGVQTFTRGSVNVLILVAVIYVLGVSDSTSGVLLGVLGAGAVTASIVLAVTVDGRRLARYVGVGVSLWGLPLVAIGIWPEWPVVIAAMAAIGVGNALVDVGMFTVPARLVPDDMLARYFGTLESVVALSVACGSLLTPVIVAAAGRRGALIVVGLLGPLVVVAYWRRLRVMDQTVAGRDEEIGILKRIPMFDPLPMPAIETIAARVGRTRVAPGAVVVAEGAPGDRYYVITSGTAIVRRQGHDVRELHAGDGFGEIGLLRDVPRTASVLAMTELELRTIDRADFLGPVTGYASAARRADDVVTSRLAADASTDAADPPDRG